MSATHARDKLTPFVFEHAAVRGGIVTLESVLAQLAVDDVYRDDLEDLA